jgi:TolA-binding protein
MASVDGQPVGQTPQSVWVEAGTPHLVQIDLGKLRASRVVSVAARATRGVELRIDDTDDQRLQVSLQMTEKQLERLRGRMARLNQHHPNQLGEALATTHHEELLEEEVDRLEQREQEIEGTLAAHRTELEDRARTQPAR